MKLLPSRIFPSGTPFFTVGCFTVVCFPFRSQVMPSMSHVPAVSGVGEMIPGLAVIKEHL